MTVYDTELDYIKDQLSSYRKAKKNSKKSLRTSSRLLAQTIEVTMKKLCPLYSQALSISIVSEESSTIRTNIIWSEKIETNESNFSEYE